MIKLLFFIVIIACGAGFGLTWVSSRLPQENEFITGKVPSPKPNGDYKGSALYTGPWRGKSFDASKSAGINLIEEKGKVVKKFSFKTYIGKGIQDTEKDVMKLDYNVPQNPFWMHPLVDEIVQVSKNKYLGKIEVSVIPSKPFTLGFFYLEK